jgi:hypothetical protein
MTAPRTATTALGVSLERRAAIAVPVLLLIAAGCGGGGSTAASPTVNAASAPSHPAPPPAARPATAALLPKEPEPGPERPPLSYEPKGRRDPFVATSTAKERPGLSVTGMKLGGIVRGSVPLALVEASDGIGYILKPGDVLGDGRVTEITANSVSFAVEGKPGESATTVTLRLGGD